MITTYSALALGPGRPPPSSLKRPLLSRARWLAAYYQLGALMSCCCPCALNACVLTQCYSTNQQYTYDHREPRLKDGLERLVDIDCFDIEPLIG